MFDPELDKLLNNESSFLEFVSASAESAGKSRIRCTLTGHEMPVSSAAVNSYMETPKYATLRGIKLAVINSPYSQFIEEHGINYFCKLTNRLFAAGQAKDIENHFNGKKFQRALKKHKEEEAKKAEEQVEEMEEAESGSDFDAEEMEAEMKEFMSDSEEGEENSSVVPEEEIRTKSPEVERKKKRKINVKPKSGKKKKK